MINGKKVIVVMPAFRAAKTVEMTWDALPHAIVDYVLLVDDASNDGTARVARSLGINVRVHEENRGYGANQKTCYDAALATDADIVVMVHPDYQYEPRLVTAMAAMIESGVYDAVLGSRILGGQALAGGMPVWKYVANRALTLFENLMLGAKLSEYHTGYRAFSRTLLERSRWRECSNDFVFDNEMLAQIILGEFRLGEISVPTKYFDDASSINFARSVRYGFGVLRVSVAGLLWRVGIRWETRFARLGDAGLRQ
ncbi:glycosyltransferase family 2 protein [Chromohalobacter sp.]|uniref:glycosyltransferase family 2 protein n=1 Tax=Chromohalobacter sp. TaxID=50740 RepID=UPI00258C9CDB|nr:glycosyltransferase family 2 protein [Chromohalobacter sp.]MCI0594527.1 glycosyltransferase family 2 protein [Chromohalobacter sp.]